MSTNWYYDKYSNAGLSFTDDILTRYALSLATKPFVILTGISGTGKSKIATLFEAPPPPPIPTPAAATANHIAFNVKQGMLSTDGRGNFDYSDISKILEPAQVQQFDQDKTDILNNNLGDRNFPNDYEIEVDTSTVTNTTSSIKLLVYGQRARNPLLRIRTKSRSGNTPAWSSQDYFQQHHQLNDVIVIEKTAPGKFKIVSVNGGATTATPQLLSANDAKCVIPVKSNWVDSSELFGYYNQLTEKYHVTKFLRFLLQARDFPETPHFLVLDEMNLAKVEHYFSDYLSCIESRRLDGTDIVQEPVPLYGNNTVLDTDDDVYDEIPSEIEIPLNLFVTGTVNIDDSTHMFSPKVLDRANVLEFNEVNLVKPINNGLKLATFPDFYTLEIAKLDDFNNLDPAIKLVIQKLLDALKKEHLHFGYRTLSELGLFIKNGISSIANDAPTRKNLLDIQILQKILPKFVGTSAKLEPCLKEMVHILSGTTSNLNDLTPKAIADVDVTTTDYPRSLSKLQRMYKSVITQGFVSFVE